MDAYKDVALGVESAWPAFVLAVAQALTPSVPPENQQDVESTAALTSSQVIV